MTNAAYYLTFTYAVERRKSLGGEGGSAFLLVNTLVEISRDPRDYLRNPWHCQPEPRWVSWLIETLARPLAPAFNYYHYAHVLPDRPLSCASGDRDFRLRRLVQHPGFGVTSGTRDSRKTTGRSGL